MRTVGEIVKESLVQLRKGRGVQSKDLESRIDPEFAALIGTSVDTGTALRVRVVAYLNELMTGLPESLERVARCALNVPPAPDGDTLRQRLTGLAGEFFYDERTARRRMDDAFERMVANADRGQAPMPGVGHGGTGWYVDMFEAVVRLDLPSPEAVERRTIVVTADSLDKIVTSIDIPKDPSNGSGPVGVAPEMMFGGLLAATGQGSSTNFSTDITLPRTLHRGERHTYGLIQRIPPGQRMATRYVYVPYRQCRFFTLVVRFHPDRVPGTIWRHDGAPYSAVHDDPVPGAELVPDKAYEVSTQFRDLINGCAYGIQWR
ncbi:hypothetical protein ALI144C_23185 [Actinosynnema sp. ALI-1.44]|uniref:hypothetical protein n=1 Tax=Actinosynnema sp. ALI-1.44 TaxID=1933779 RepID=UPI00097C3281|nr:hypothetical protein [Actinosynnema sp. ALI-1.44]ONI79672.1 hypothetical protein ALI144C_23185 [Actinosynnema sp. ALI-1.44]